jgi:site-specific DNA-methyltransferase (adenine-specific)
MNFLGRGDALEICATLPNDLRFDLVYLDPPYAVGTAMTARMAPGQTRGKRTRTGGPVAYEDRYDPDALVAMLMPRLAAIRDCMNAGATLYVHSGSPHGARRESGGGSVIRARGVFG